MVLPIYTQRCPHYLLYLLSDKFDDDPDNDGGGVILCPGCTRPIGPAGDADMLPMDP